MNQLMRAAIGRRSIDGSHRTRSRGAPRTGRSAHVASALIAPPLVLLCALPVNAATQATWMRKASAPFAVTEVGAAVLQGKLYVVGGGAQRGQGADVPVSATNLMFDPQTNSWHERSPLPQPLSHVGVTAYAGKLYAIGGFTADVHLHPVNRAFVYDPQTNRWSELPQLSGPRGSVAAAAVDGKIHIFGGRISNKIEKITLKGMPGTPVIYEGLGTVSTHEIFDPTTGKWSEGKPLPGPARDHLGIAVLGGKIHVLGGRIDDFHIVARHDVYDPKTDSWSVAAPLPGERSSGAATVLDGLLLYAGGECKPGGQPGTPNTWADVDAYDPKADHWTHLTDLPQGRHGFGAATIRNVAYFAGGAPLCGGGASADLFALSLSPSDRLANFYGNTLSVTGPEGTTRLWYKPDHTFTAIDENGVSISGRWQQSGDQLCSFILRPAPRPKHCAKNDVTHEVGDRWQSSRANGARVHIMLTAGR